MPVTIEELGRKAKEKYPGAYDHVPDAELGRKIQEKFPGAYEVVGSQQQEPVKAEEPPTALSRFLTSLGEMVNIPGGIWAGLTAHNPREQWKAVSDVLESPRGSAEEAAAIERGMKVPLSNPMGLTPPPGLEPVPMATGQAMGGDLAGAAGTLTGAAALPLAGTALSSRIPSLNLRVPGFQSLNPQEAAAVKWAQDRGIFIPGGTAGGSWAAKGTQALARVTPFGTYLAEKFEPRAAEALQREGRGLAEQSFPRQMHTPVTAGESVLGSLRSKSERLQNQANVEYQLFDDLSRDPATLQTVQQGIYKSGPRKGQPVMEDVNLPVNIGELKDIVRPIYDDLKIALSPADQYTSAGFRVLRSILGSKPFMGARQAEISLGALKEMARTKTGRNAGIAKQLIPELQRRIDDAVMAADENALTGLQEGRGLIREKAFLDEVHQRITGATPENAADFAEPARIVTGSTQRKDASIARLRLLDRLVPEETGKIARSVLEDILNESELAGGLPKGADQAFARWNALGDETKKLLFPNPLQRQNLNNFFLAAKKMAENPNPSGTAIVSAIGAQTGAMGALTRDPFTTLLSHVPANVLAGLIYTPRGVKLLTQGMTGSPGAALMASHLLSQAGRKAEAEDAMPAPSGISDEEKIRRLLEQTGTRMLPAVR